MTQKFAYKSRDQRGQVVEGEISAASEALAAAKLRETGMTPLSLEATGGGLKTEIKIPGLSDRVKLKDVAVFSRQFATMINSGLSLLRALGILATQTENDTLADVIAKISIEVEAGVALSDAMAEHPKVFNDLYVSMIRAGEVAGVLDSVLVQLAETIEKQVELRGKIKSAMTYPVAVLGLVTVILGAMLVFVVPMFKTLYADLGGDLPAPTQLLITLSSLITSTIHLIIPAVLILVFLVRKWANTSSGRMTVDALKLKLPVFGPLIHKTAVARFSRTLESLLRAGVPILESLTITKDTVGNAVMAKAVEEVQEAVRSGESVSVPLGQTTVFPAMAAQMIAVGEETGALDDMLGKIGQFYEQEIEALVDALTSLLEPLLIVVLGGAVGSMVVALYLPMFNIINLVQ